MARSSASPHWSRRVPTPTLSARPCWQRGQLDFQCRCAMAARTGSDAPCGTAGLVLDLTPVRQCLVNVEALEATISGGVTVADLNDAAGRHALAAVIGNDGAVSMA